MTESVVRALDATTEARDHFRSSGSLTGFDEHVERGVSHEMVRALRDIVSGAEASEITVELVRTSDDPIGWRGAEIRTFEFSRSDVSVFDQASNHLATAPEVERIRVVGRVHLLTRKEAGGPGVFGIESEGRRYRVRLRSDVEYHEAVMAHDRERHIAVIGDLSREGTLSWLYDSVLLPDVDLPVEMEADKHDAQSVFRFPDAET